LDLVFTVELANLRDSEDRMRQQHLESTQREKVLVRRLATKEQEMQEYAVCSVTCISVVVEASMKNIQ